MRRALAAAVLFTISFGVSASAGAEPSPFEVERAKVIASEGLGLYDKGEFQDALTKLQEAQAVADAPTIGLYAARCLNKLNRLLDAKEAYAHVVAFELPPTAPPQWTKAKEDAAAELADLEPRIPSLEIALLGLGDRPATARIDGKPIDPPSGSHAVDPGAHLVEIVVGEETFPTTIEVSPGEKLPVNVNVGGAAPAEPERGPPVLDILGWTGVGVGGALLVVWGATGAAALAQASDLGCDGDACRGDVSGLGSLRTASTATFWIGLPIGLAGGALLLVPRLLGDPEPQEGEVSVTPVVGPGFVGVAGRF